MYQIQPPKEKWLQDFEKCSITFDMISNNSVYVTSLMEGNSLAAKTTCIGVIQ